MDDPNGGALARELSSQLLALLTPEPTGTPSSSAAPPGPDGRRPGRVLPSLAGPRTILENGSRFASPVLPADAPFRAAKAVVLRALRIVTRDQTVFNSAVVEALRSGLSETEDVLREVVARTSDLEETARARAEQTDQRLDEAFGRLDGAGAALEEALGATRGRLAAAEAGLAGLEASRLEASESVRVETAAREALAAEHLSTQRRTDALEAEAKRVEEALDREGARRELLAAEHLSTQRRADVLEAATRRIEETLGGEAARREALAAEHLSTQRRADALEAETRRIEEALDREAARREALAAEHLATQRRLDVAEALEARREKDLDRESAAREALAADVHASQRRLDVAEVRADDLRGRLAEAERRAESAAAGLLRLETEASRLSEELRGARLEWSSLRASLRGRVGEPAGASVAALAGPVGAVRAPAAPHPASSLLSSGLYADFERRFRGDEAEIRRRQEEDVALLAAAPGPVADLGCGRGELLEALRARGVAAVGCDSNPVMVARCREKGLDAHEAELFAWLEGQQDGSLGGVTAYQVVEHLPADLLPYLVELAAAKLARGGRLLLETVNPESVYAMRWFWMDLTHVRPVPGPALGQLLSAAGFRDVEVRYRAEVPEAVSGPLRSVADPVLAAAGRLLFAPQDVVVTGVR